MDVPARRIAVVTGTRAEYGLLKGLMAAVRDDASLRLQILATGMHLESRFGHTVDEILADGFVPDAEVPLGLDDDSGLTTARAMGRGLLGMAEALDRLRPDVVVVLGDRFEILTAVQAALVQGIPVAHIHGGELTEGVIDDDIRHAVTKMASLHFVAAEVFARRVRQLGEEPERIFVVGAPGVDALAELAPLPREVLEADLGLSLTAPLFLATYHPETLGDRPPVQATAEFLGALESFPGARVVFTGVNADPGRDAVAAAIARFVQDHPERAAFRESLGQRRYLSLMRLADAVIGNSSSGIIEAPAAGVPTINVGDRQKGRPHAESVIDCAPDRQAIGAAIRQALTPGFRARAKAQTPPYGGGGAAGRIKAILKSVPLAGLTRKRFVDQAGG
ncbi:MAG: UDP-N-acetylglucosamine 2-epimerase [Magnetospirillum sp. WYHS-4]